MSAVFGNVPHPPFQDRPIDKPDGQGQDYLGKRIVKGVVWHRILGSLWGTDSYFRRSDVYALTDYGIGVLAQDGASNDGLILRWNDPRGDQSGWASGPVNAPYGDGLAFVNKYGVNAVNRDQVSIEISGFQTTPLSEKSRQSIAALTAFYADQYGIPWDVFPIAPQDGFSFVRWHQEFTIGSGKQCPFSVVMNETNALIERTRAILKQYQVSGPTIELPAEDTNPKPNPPGKPDSSPPKPDYADPDVPEWLIDDNMLGIERIGTTPTYPVSLVFTALRDTPRRQGGDPNLAEVGPPLKKGQRFKSTRVFRSRNKVWVLTKNGSRIAADDLTPRVLVSIDGHVSVDF